MKFLHPLFMAGVLYFVYVQRNLGLSIFRLREKDPAFDQRPAMLATHRSYGIFLVFLCLLGFVGGILSTAYLLGWAPFLQTFGHGFVGALGLSVLVMMLVLGMNAKYVVKPKIRERFMSFHTNMIYIFGLFCLFSVLTGILSLVWGPGKLPTN